MAAKAPVAKGIPLDANAGDIVTRVSMLESSLSAFMKQLNDQMRNLTSTLGNLGPIPSASLRTQTLKHVKVVTNVDSPSKRKRVEDSDEVLEKVAGDNSGVNPVRPAL